MQALFIFRNFDNNDTYNDTLRIAYSLSQWDTR
jgi:hypothetical protein